MFIHQVQERQHEFRIAFHGVDVVVDGDQADAEHAERIDGFSDFQIFASQTAHVFDDNGFHASAFDALHHIQIAGTVKAGSGNSVVGKMLDVEKSVSAGIILQLFLLIGNGVGFAGLFILVAEAFIQGCDFCFCHTL